MKGKPGQIHHFDKAAFWQHTKTALLLAMTPGFLVSLVVLYRWTTMYTMRQNRGMRWGEQLLELMVFHLFIFVLCHAGVLLVYHIIRKARQQSVFFVEEGNLVWRKTRHNLGDEHDPEYRTWDYRIQKIDALTRKGNGAIVIEGNLERVELYSDNEPMKTLRDNRLVDDTRTKRKLTIPPYYQEMETIWQVLQQAWKAQGTAAGTGTVEKNSDHFKDQDDEVTALLTAVEQQDPEAMFQIGRMYFLGKEEALLKKVGHYFYGTADTEQDYARAFEWFADAADVGHPQAAMYAGILLRDHGGLVHGSPGQAESYLALAAAHGFKEESE